MTTTDKDFEILASLEKKIKQTAEIGLDQILVLRLLRFPMFQLLKVQNKLE